VGVCVCVCVCVCACLRGDLGIEHAMRMCHIVICGLTGYTVYLTNGTVKKKKY